MVLYVRSWYGMGAFYRWVLSADGRGGAHMPIVNFSRDFHYGEGFGGGGYLRGNGLPGCVLVEV